MWPAFLTAEPLAPRREVDALELASARGLPAPRVVAADVSGKEVGDGTPCVLVTRVPGRPVARPSPVELAELSAAIHAVDPSGLGHEYFPWYREVVTRPPPGSLRPKLWERAISMWRDQAPPYVPTLVHRDLHPGNVLWRRGRISGVVDWVNACRGPSGCDLAHCRANLAALAGEAIADEFVAAYASLTGVVLHPYWVLASILEHDPSAWTPESLAAVEPGLERAVSEMGG